MRYVTVKRDISKHENGVIIRSYAEKRYEAGDYVTMIGLGLLVSVAVFLLGYYTGVVATAEKIAEATEQVATVDKPKEEEPIEDGLYSPTVPLSYTEQAELMSAAEEFGVDYYTMLGLIEKETNFRNVSGDNGKASGYCQIWKVYWKDLMVDIGAEDLNVPKDNFRTACAIMRQLTDRYGSTAGALTAYNTGSFDGNVAKYAMTVLENAEKWREI